MTFIMTPRAISALCCAIALLTGPGAGASVAEQKTYRDWSVSCEDGQGLCAAAQTVSGEGGLWLLSVALIPRANNTARLVATVPGAVHLGSGLFLTAPGSRTVSAQFLHCAEGRCVAEAEIEADTLRTWMDQANAEVRYRPQPGRPVLVFDLSLMGVTAALKAAR